MLFWYHLKNETNIYRWTYLLQRMAPNCNTFHEMVPYRIWRIVPPESPFQGQGISKTKRNIKMIEIISLSLYWMGFYRSEL